MGSLPLLLLLPRLVYPLASRILENNRKMTRFFTSLSREAATSYTASQQSFSASLIKGYEKGKLADEEIAFLTGSLIGDGVDTTSNTTFSFVFALCASPEVQ